MEWLARTRNGWRAAAGDDGFTLVEAVVALTVFAVGILSVAQMMDAAFSTAGHTSQRAKATALATKAIESARAQSFETLLPQAQGDPTEQTVETVGNTPFTIERTITTVPGAAYKQVKVDVSWADARGGHGLHQTTFVYPTATAAAATEPSPLLNSIFPSFTTLSQWAVDGTATLAWTPPVSGERFQRFILQKSLDSAFAGRVWTIADREPPESRTFQVTGLASGSTYYFRIAAVRADGAMTAWSPVSAVQTAASLATEPCRVRNVTVSPSAVPRVASLPSPLASTPVVAVETSGTCTGLYITYSAPSATPIPLGPNSGSNTNVLTAEITNTAASKWQLGQYTIEVRDSASTKRGSAAFTVCEQGGVCG